MSADDELKRLRTQLAAEVEAREEIEAHHQTLFGQLLIATDRAEQLERRLVRLEGRQTAEVRDAYQYGVGARYNGKTLDSRYLLLYYPEGKAPDILQLEQAQAKLEEARAWVAFLLAKLVEERRISPEALNEWEGAKLERDQDNHYIVRIVKP